MSRGLTEQPNPEQPSGPTNADLDEAIEELFGLVGALYAKVDTLEKVLGHAVNLPESEAADRKRLKGL
jgi:hypothetical protein